MRWDVQPEFGFPLRDTGLGSAKGSFRWVPLDWVMRIPDVVKEAVVFFSRRLVKNDKSTEENVGSGFIAAIDDGETLFPYLVTADHVAHKLEEFGFQAIVRMNGKDGVAYERDITSIGPSNYSATNWLRHPDKSVDLAVALFGDFEGYLAFVPERQFLKLEALHEKGIGIGDETIAVGLFHFVKGCESNSPIARVGNIAMLPTERIHTVHYGDMEAYLIEARSISGLSGSPVFVRETKELPHELAIIGKRGDENEVTIPYLVGGDFFLLGLIHGHWDIELDSGINNAEPLPTSAGGVNVGIAIVTPASKISDVLFSSTFTAQREDHKRSRAASRTTI